jgi:hypothetical protein
MPRTYVNIRDLALGTPRLNSEAVPFNQVPRTPISIKPAHAVSLNCATTRGRPDDQGLICAESHAQVWRCLGFTQEKAWL